MSRVGGIFEKSNELKNKIEFLNINNHLNNFYNSNFNKNFTIYDNEILISKCLEIEELKN